MDYVGETCEVTCEDNGRSVTADLLSFTKEKFISVSIEKSIRLNMTWNGKVYSGRMGKLTFNTFGPTINTVNVKGRI